MVKIYAAVVVCVGLLIRLTLISKLHINGDEINFYEIGIYTSFKDIITIKYWAIDYPQIYFLFVRFISLFSTELIHIKIANQIFYLISAIFVYKIGEKLYFHSYTSLIPLIIYSASSFLIENEINVNPYSAATAFTCIIIYYYLNTKEKASLNNLLFLVIGIFIGTHISYSVLFVVLAIIVDALLLLQKEYAKFIRIFIFIGLAVSPSIIQIILSINNFSSLTPESSTLINTLFQFKNSAVPINSIYQQTIMIGTLLTISVFNSITEFKSKSFFLILIVSVIFSLFILEILDLYIAVRLLYPLYLGLIFLITSRRKKFTKVLIILILLLVYFSIQFMVKKPSYKHLYQSISKNLYDVCKSKSTIIIDSSDFRYYSLYHYYFNHVVPFNTSKYECLLGRSTVFDSSVKREKKWVYDGEQYYFINMSKKQTNINNYLSLCRNAECYIFNPELMRFDCINHKNFAHQYAINFVH